MIFLICLTNYKAVFALSCNASFVNILFFVFKYKIVSCSFAIKLKSTKRKYS